jgi:hypothetical protein
LPPVTTVESTNDVSAPVVSPILVNVNPGQSRDER